MAFVKPTLTFELGLTAGFRDLLSTVAWTDITPYVLSWSTSRGREPKKPPSHFEAGTASLTLNNRDRRFDPTNTSSPYSPNLRPARVRLRIRATYSAVTYDVFTGYIKRWPPEWSAPAVATTKITAVDALGAPLNLARIYGSLFETTVRHEKPRMWLRMAEGSGTFAADATINRLDGQYQGAPTLGQPSLLFTDASSKSVRFVAGSRLSLPYRNLIAGYPFSVECWFKAATGTATRAILMGSDGAMPSAQEVEVYISGTAPHAGQVVASVAGALPTRTRVKSTSLVNDNFRHHLVVVFTSSTDFKVYLDGTLNNTAIETNAHSFPANLTAGYAVGNTVGGVESRFGNSADDLLAEVVIYPSALTASRINKHYAAGTGYASFLKNSGAHAIRLLEEADWPGDYLIDTGAAQLQTATTAGSVVSNLQVIEDSEQGALFVDEAGRIVFHGRYALDAAPYNTSQVTLEQGVGTLAYEAPVTWGNDDAELFNSAEGSRQGGGSFTVRDEASVTDYGERPLGAVNGLWNEADSEVVDLLTWRVAKYAQPVSSVRQVRLHPAALNALYPHVLGIGLRELVTVKVAPPGGGPVFSQPSRVERISHAVDDKGDWFTTWDVSAADDATVLTTDHASLGLLDSTPLLGL